MALSNVRALARSLSVGTHVLALLAFGGKGPFTGAHLIIFYEWTEV